MPPDARDIARAWLAETLSTAPINITIGETGLLVMIDNLANAILNAPGVQVQIAWAPYGHDAGTGRLAIMLPIAVESADGGRE